MVSKFGHCLNDLLFRHSSGSLRDRHPGRGLQPRGPRADGQEYGIPFHHIPISPETKAEAEAELIGLVDSLDIELVVLARYMQVLSPELSHRLSGRVINIHHSFLPSFKGAKPYHQAHIRGVKLVGATAHYVTDDLDEGPIIEQDVTRVDHQLEPERAGRGRPRRRGPGPGPRGALARRAPGPAQRHPHRRLPLSTGCPRGSASAAGVRPAACR